MDDHKEPEIIWENILPALPELLDIDERLNLIRKAQQDDLVANEQNKLHNPRRTRRKIQNKTRYLADQEKR